MSPLSDGRDVAARGAIAGTGAQLAEAITARKINP